MACNCEAEIEKTLAELADFVFENGKSEPDESFGISLWRSITLFLQRREQSKATPCPR